jgi:hypothetical protein
MYHNSFSPVRDLCFIAKTQIANQDIHFWNILALLGTFCPVFGSSLFTVLHGRTV